MTFAHPEMLWLLAATLPLLVWFLVWAWRRKQALIREFVQSRLLAQLTVGVSARRQKLRLVLLAAAATLLLVALARPQIGFAWEEAHQRGLDILVGIDTSRSMLATDVAPNRLTRAKLAALDLMRAARADRLGLIAFAGTAFLQCPLTLDDNAFSESVNYLDVDTIPQGGTALAEAINTAVRAFKESGDNHKVLVLFTDGEDHESGVIEAATRAAEAQLLIFPVGIGTLEGDRLRVVDEQGKTTYLSDSDGQTVISKLNMTLLEQIAAKTKGDFLKLGGADPMKLLYDARLAPLPRSETSTRLFRQYYERFQWPLAAAILLLIAEMFLSVRQRVRRPPSRSPAQADLRTAVALLALLLGSGPAQASADKALRDYETGKFSQAQLEYQRLLERQPNDPRLLYNAGTAAYRAGHFDQAAAALNSATLASDPKLLARAYYNLGNATYRLGQQADAPTNTLTHWEQAMRHYDSSLKLDPQDADAQFNRSLVARKIEELRQQQQQQQSSDPNQQDQNQDQKDNDNQKQNQKQNQDQKQDQNKQQKQDPSKDQQSSQERSSPENQTSKERQPDKPKEPKPNQDSPAQQEKSQQDRQKESEQPKPDEGGEAQAKPRQEQGPEAKSGEAPLATALGQMTPEQARQLLEAAKAEERPMIFVPPEARRQSPGLRREW